MSESAACRVSSIADDPSDLLSPPPLPPPVSNSSCLLTQCQPLCASCYTILLYFSRYCRFSSARNHVVDQSSLRTHSEEEQTLHCFLQSITSHYQPAGPSKCGRGTGGPENTRMSSLDPQQSLFRIWSERCEGMSRPSVLGLILLELCWGELP